MSELYTNKKSKEKQRQSIYKVPSFVYSEPYVIQTTFYVPGLHDLRKHRLGKSNEGFKKWFNETYVRVIQLEIIEGHQSLVTGHLRLFPHSTCCTGLPRVEQAVPGGHKGT